VVLKLRGGNLLEKAKPVQAETAGSEISEALLTYII
jgi:hypothetical protein